MPPSFFWESPSGRKDRVGRRGGPKRATCVAGISSGGGVEKSGAGGRRGPRAGLLDFGGAVDGRFGRSGWREAWSVVGRRQQVDAGVVRSHAQANRTDAVGLRVVGPVAAGGDVRDEQRAVGQFHGLAVTVGAV